MSGPLTKRSDGLLGLLKRFSGGLPARKARGEMLHVAITKISESMLMSGKEPAKAVTANAKALRRTMRLVINKRKTRRGGRARESPANE
jgi:hypothetical protein